MAALLSQAKLSDNQRVELYEGGIVWIVQEEAGKVVREIKLDAAAVGWFVDFLLLHQGEFDYRGSSEATDSAG